MTADVLEINNLRSRHSKAVVLVKKLTPDGFSCRLSITDQEETI